jgi:2-dehydro-3-deoxygalactonokinase
VIGEVRAEEGNARMNDLWLNRQEQESSDRFAFYLRHLQTHIDRLAQQVPVPLEGVPVVLSGMATSTIGMMALPYAPLPFAADGSQAVVHRVRVGQDQPREVLLISGVASDRDVMRGEETQLVGLWDTLPAVAEAGEAVFVLPGTHSKHMRVREGRLVDFQTFMTGELFQVMASHSILKDSVEKATEAEGDGEAMEGFRQGIQQSGQAGLLPSLFTVRTNQLLGAWPKKKNFFYLSGLLIGEELRTLLAQDVPQIVLGSGSQVFRLYRAGLEQLGLLSRTTVVPADQMEHAAIAGQLRIFRQVQGDLEI